MNNKLFAQTLCYPKSYLKNLNWVNFYSVFLSLNKILPVNVIFRWRKKFKTKTIPIKSEDISIDTIFWLAVKLKFQQKIHQHYFHHLYLKSLICKKQNPHLKYMFANKTE